MFAKSFLNNKPGNSNFKTWFKMKIKKVSETNFGSSLTFPSKNLMINAFLWLRHQLPARLRYFVALR